MKNKLLNALVLGVKYLLVALLFAGVGLVVHNIGLVMGTVWLPYMLSKLADGILDAKLKKHKKRAKPKGQGKNRSSKKKKRK